MTWIAKNTGATAVDITFRLARAISDDGEGGAPSGSSSLVIPVRLVPITGANDANNIIQNQFPGANTYDYLFWGWINDRRNYKFPKELRQQQRPIGECTLPDLGSGRIECSIGLYNPTAAQKIGEKFTAIWTRA